MLKSIHKKGHCMLKVLQMTNLLHTLGDYLNMEYGLQTFERVDSSVSVAEHHAAFAQFTRFLLSVRTCGLGINLASADTVINDSDFKSHTDNQAMDWAHQIGYCSRHSVYMLVICASVEELILLLATKKLICDQPFLYKSASPREVETEEPFTDPSNVIQLQKVCKYLYLIRGTEPDSGSLVFFHEKQFKASAELTLLKSMRTSIHKEGHWLKFFQMTKLLHTLKDYLNMEYEPQTFESVDDSVSVAEHQAAFAQFPHFLFSGRTCGLVLNLASADTVISYDSDFDSYTDNKEIDWAHQIGHCTELLVYILVIHASVEELVLLLATKKLTCDQLFVYKSGSPKEVENILIWRTGELFAGPSTVSGKNGTEDSLAKDVSNINIESKQKRVGGIGVVYEDECTDGNPRNFGDGSAVLKLLDCSILQFAPPEAAELDLEKDMFGSVKSMERISAQLKNKRQLNYLLLWLKMSTHSFEKSEDHAAGGENQGNEWIHLLPKGSA